MKVAFTYHFNDKDWNGGRNYFASLFNAINLVKPKDLQLVFITGKKTITSLPEEFPSLEVIRTPLLDRYHPYWLLRQLDLRLFDGDRLRARFLRNHDIDLLSHSGYLGQNSGVKTLDWLYDFQFMHLPEFWESKHLRWIEKRYSAACNQCNGVIVSSYSALKDLNHFAPLSKAPKHVLRFVSNPINFSHLLTRQEVTTKYSLPEKYIYLPNQFWTSKNHRLVIDALNILKRQGLNATVVCTGNTKDGRKPEYFDELMKYRSTLGLSEQFKVLGIIPYVDTQTLMAHSHAVLNPSRFEGWSTAVEEAKTFQKPLLLSDIPVHREQAPALGKFFTVDDSQALATLIHGILTSEYQEINQTNIAADYQSRLSDFGKAYLNILNSVMGKT